MALAWAKTNIQSLERKFPLGIKNYFKFRWFLNFFCSCGYITNGMLTNTGYPSTMVIYFIFLFWHLLPPNSDVELKNPFKCHPLLSWQFCSKLLECDCSCSLVDIPQTAARGFVVGHATTSRKKTTTSFKFFNFQNGKYKTDRIFNLPNQFLASVVGTLFWGYFQCIQMQSSLRLLVEYTYLIQIITAGALSFSFPDLVP